MRTDVHHSSKARAHAVLRGRQQPGCLYMPAATLGAEWLLQLLAVVVGGGVVRCPFIETLVACAMVKPIVCFINFYTGVAAFLAAQRRLPSFPAHRSSSPTVAGNSRIAMHGSVDLLRGVPLPQSEQLSPLSSIVPARRRRKRETYWLADDFHRWCVAARAYAVGRPRRTYRRIALLAVGQCDAWQATRID